MTRGKIYSIALFVMLLFLGVHTYGKYSSFGAVDVCYDASATGVCTGEDTLKLSIQDVKSEKPVAPAPQKQPAKAFSSMSGRDSLLVTYGFASVKQEDTTWMKWSAQESEKEDSVSNRLLDSLQYAGLAAMSAKELRRHQRDSIHTLKDSLIRATPRVLDSRPFSDSIMFKRVFLWKNDTWFNTMESVKHDTLYNTHFRDLPYLRNDVGAEYLGVSGSPMQYYNFFNREQTQLFPFFDVYKPYTYTPDDVVHYNTKTPYTELGYWGTFFINREQEESNLRIMHTQNVSPAFNFQVMYERKGARGIMQRESTDHRTFLFSVDYLGKKYTAHAGYMFSRVKRNENGGMVDPWWVKDTTVDARTIPVNLKDASSEYYRTTVWLSHSLKIPFKFMNRKASHAGDSLPANSLYDSLSRESEKKFASARARTSTAPEFDGKALMEIDDWDGTTAYLGHYFEYTKYARNYRDEIPLDDETGRAFYNNRFYINPTNSADSVNSVNVENRVYLRMQPWKMGSAVSNLDVGIGYQFLKFFTFSPEYFLTGTQRPNETNGFLYFGANGMVKKYFSWQGFAKYNFSGYNSGDININGAMRFSAYPNSGGVHFIAKIDFRNERPSYFYNNLVTNHNVWLNDFEKMTNTKIEAKVNIPDYRFEVSAGYALLKNNIYLNEYADACQNSDAMSVFSAYLRKDFKIGILMLENRFLFQTSSDEKVMPLPKFSVNLRYYLEFSAVKNVLKMQIGADGTWNTKYYKSAYAPNI